jgi:urease gamma subunit
MWSYIIKSVKLFLEMAWALRSLEATETYITVLKRRIDKIGIDNASSEISLYTALRDHRNEKVKKLYPKGSDWFLNNNLVSVVAHCVSMTNEISLKVLMEDGTRVIEVHYSKLEAIDEVFNGK